jgi:glycosyltransferase involved in cell wall biosynthesis
MLSVIVPTLWEVPGFKYFINVVAESTSVKEVLIIDNASHIRYALANGPFFSHPKLKIIPLPENVGTNQAWNIGAFIAESDNIALLNDDVFFDISALAKIDHKLLNHPEIGLICANTQRLYGAGVTSNDISFERTLQDMHVGAGTMIFLHKAKYRKIPKELRIYYGDNYLWDTLRAEGYHHYKLINCAYFSLGGETTQVLQSKDLINPSRLLQDEGNIYYSQYAPGRAPPGPF